MFHTILWPEEGSSYSLLSYVCRSQCSFISPSGDFKVLLIDHLILSTQTVADCLMNGMGILKYIIRSIKMTKATMNRRIANQKILDFQLNLITQITRTLFRTQIYRTEISALFIRYADILFIITHSPFVVITETLDLSYTSTLLKKSPINTFYRKKSSHLPRGPKTTQESSQSPPSLICHFKKPLLRLTKRNLPQPTWKLISHFCFLSLKE